MTDAALLSSLIQLIYDAALDPDLWEDALHRTAGFVGASAAGLHAKYAALQPVPIHHHDGVDDKWLRRYAEDFVRFDPSTTRQLLAPLEEPISLADVMPYDEYLDTKFYLEWAAPQGFVDAITVVLKRSGADMSVLAMLRDQGDGVADDEALLRLRLLAPHIRRATLVAEAIGDRAAEARQLGDTLDAIAAGVFLLDASGRIVHANAAARAMLASTSLFAGACGRLTPLDRDADRDIVAILAASVEADEGGCGTPAVATPLHGRDGELYVVHALPLTSEVRHARSVADAVVALFVRPASLGQVTTPDALARAYGLTPGELRVLLAIVDVGGSPEVADALGVAETTVKFHLRQLFDKTETHRQADLVKLVAGFANPLIS